MIFVDRLMDVRLRWKDGVIKWGKGEWWKKYC